MSHASTCSLKLFSFHSTVFNSPSITPDTSQLIITEGDSTTLTCIRDSTNTFSDQYRWTLPNGSVSPPQPASAPIDLILSTINRNQSGLYVCTGTRPGTLVTVNATITINVQCKLIYTDYYNVVNLLYVYNCACILEPVTYILFAAMMKAIIVCYCVIIIVISVLQLFITCTCQYSTL